MIKIIFYFSKEKFRTLQAYLSLLLSNSVFFTHCALDTIYDTLDSFSHFHFSTDGAVVYFEFRHQLTAMGALILNANFLNIYYFPFIYIFVLVTILSILFCLSYNANELIIFIFYCFVIILAGYSLFFTDSVTLFFLSYEFLLVPSFFILYKFAKTRRCVEAAYLMFF